MTPVMTSQFQSDTLAGEQRRGPATTAVAELDALVASVRAAVKTRASWAHTAELVASALERHLPAPSILKPEQRSGDRKTYESEVLHAEPDGSFSIVALVWLRRSPGCPPGGERPRACPEDWRSPTPARRLGRARR